MTMMMMMMMMTMMGEDTYSSDIRVSGRIKSSVHGFRGIIHTHALGESIGDTISSSGGFSSVSSRKCASP